MAVCVVLGMVRLSCQMYVCRVVHSIHTLIVLLVSAVSVLIPVSFLILVICVFSFSLLVLLEVCQCYWSFQRTCSMFHWFFSHFPVFNSLISALVFTIFLTSDFFAVVFFFFFFTPFSGFLWWELGWLTRNFSNVCIYCYKFPSHTALAVPQTLTCCISIFIQFYVCFDIPWDFVSLTHGSFRSVLFTFQEFGDFSYIFLWLISGLIPLWSENVWYQFC